MSTHYYWAPPPAILDLSIMLSGDASLLVGTKDVERETERNKKKDDISDTHKSTDQSRPTVVVGIKSSFSMQLNKYTF
jgi:hypothetical protein